MGLFDGKGKKDLENEVLEKLAKVPLLDSLIESILFEDQEPWLQMGQSYYDSCRRVVNVEPDSFEIKWSGYHEEASVGNDGQRHTKPVEDIYGRIGYSYTKSGYLPLHNYNSNDGYKVVSTKRVCFLWASIIRERMLAKMPTCKFEDVHETGNGASFSYTVPSLSFKDWF